jgi:predicted TPR repeat methyltransferase
MPETAKVLVTDAEIDAALGRAREYEKYARRVVKAAYSKSADCLRLVLNDGAIYTVPRRLIQGLGDATERELNRIQIIGNGTGLLWPLLDIAHHVPAMLQGVYGTEKWMATLYKQGRKLAIVEARRSSKRKVA